MARMQTRFSRRRRLWEWSAKRMHNLIAISLAGGCWITATGFAQDAVPAPRKAVDTEQTTTSTKSSTASKKSRSTTTTAVEPTIVVRGDELPSAYGAPGGFSRSRFSSLTNAYVLPPGGVFA